MDTFESRSREANELRKSGRIKDALKIYRELWGGQCYNEYTAAGLLHCLWKQHHHVKQRYYGTMGRSDHKPATGSANLMQALSGGTAFHGYRHLLPPPCIGDRLRS